MPRETAHDHDDAPRANQRPTTTHTTTMTDHATRRDDPTRRDGSTERPSAAEADESADATRGRGTMGDVDHTNPKTGETFGAAHVFTRGRTAVADGGERDGETDDEVESEATTADDPQMGDVEHTPPGDAPDANRVYERGSEHGGEAESEAAQE